MVVLARRWPFDFRRFDGVIIRRRIVFSSISRSHSLCSVWERELTPRAAVSFRRLPWFGPSGASFIPAAPSPRRRAQRRSRPAVSPIVPLAPTLPGRVLTAASTTVRLIGAGRSRGSLQQRPSDDMTAAPSNTVIGLTTHHCDLVHVTMTLLGGRCAEIAHRWASRRQINCARIPRITYNPLSPTGC